MPQRKTPWLKQVPSRETLTSPDTPHLSSRGPSQQRDEPFHEPIGVHTSRSEDSLASSIVSRQSHHGSPICRVRSSRAPFADIRSATPTPQMLPPKVPVPASPTTVDEGSLIESVLAFFSTITWFLSGIVRLVRIILGLESCVLRHYGAADSAKSYSEWYEKARKIDMARGFAKWRDGPEDRDMYDHDGLQERLDDLKVAYTQAKGSGSYSEVLELLSDGINRTTYGITYSELYRKYLSGTKGVIDEYLQLVKAIIDSAAVSVTTSASMASPRSPGRHPSSQHQSIDSPSFCVSDSSDDEAPVRPLTPQVRAVFASLKRCEHLYGNVALVLNGSIALGLYHLGVVEALRQADCLPCITFGTNTGAIVAALIGCRLDYATALDPEKTNYDAFKNKSTKGGLKRKIDRFMNEGTLMDVEVLTGFVRDNVGTMTFAEAYAHTHRALNIQVAVTVGTEKSFWLLNHITAPHVLVYSAAVLSCATRGVYKPVDLMCRIPSGEVVPYDVGAYRFAASRSDKGDLNSAVERMRQLFNVRLFLVSECSIMKHPGMGIAGRKGFVFQFAHFFTEEVWRLLAAVSRRKYLQTRFTHTLQDFAAQYPQPCIVAHPASKLRDFRTLIHNPNKALIQKCELAGARVMWPMVEEIRAHVSTAAALQKAIRRVAREYPEVVSTLGA